MPGNRLISGTVVDSMGQPVVDAQLNLTGPVTQMVFTDAAGNYSFTGLVDGVYTLTPSKAGVTFSPGGRQVVVNGADVGGQFFTGRM
jgi:hypothetical protein